MLGLLLVHLQFHFVASFNAFLRGHRWKVSHGRVVVGGEMQRHCGSGTEGTIGLQANIWTETCPESELVAVVA